MVLPDPAGPSTQTSRVRPSRAGGRPAPTASAPYVVRTGTAPALTCTPALCRAAAVGRWEHGPVTDPGPARAGLAVPRRMRLLCALAAAVVVAVMAVVALLLQVLDDRRGRLRRRRPGRASSASACCSAPACCCSAGPGWTPTPTGIRVRNMRDRPRAAVVGGAGGPLRPELAVGVLVLSNDDELALSPPCRRSTASARWAPSRGCAPCSPPPGPARRRRCSTTTETTWRDPTPRE